MAKKTEVIQQVVTYNGSEEFVKKLCDTISVLEEEGYETNIAYAMSGEKYSALVIGKKEQCRTNTQDKTKKAK